MPAIIPNSVPNTAPDIASQNPACSDNSAVSIGVISEGTAGMRLQAAALGEAIKATKHPTPNLYDIIVNPPPLLRHLPRLALILPLAWLRVVIGPKLLAFSNSDPAVIITCGRRMAGLSIAMRRLGMANAVTNRSHTIHIQDPRLPPRFFDILITPQHDKARGPNVITTVASLNYLDNKKIATAAIALDPKWTRLQAPCIAVLFGGRNRRYEISLPMIDNMAKKLAEFAALTEANLALIPSRRTPKRLLAHLKRSLGATPHAILDAEDKNPYPGILGHAAAIIVTSDSVNMASEAAITGKPVLIAEWQAETGRIGAFHKAMMKAGHTAPLGDNIPKDGFTPLFEMPLVLRQVKALLWD